MGLANTFPRTLLVFLMPIALTNIGYRTYFINGAWDVVVIALIAVFWVETKGKTLEEIDAIFEGEKHSNVPDVAAVREGRASVDVKAIELEIEQEVQEDKAMRVQVEETKRQ